MWSGSRFGRNGDQPLLADLLLRCRATSLRLLRYPENAGCGRPGNVERHASHAGARAGRVAALFMGDNETALAHFQLATSLYDPVKHQPLVYSFGQDPGIAGMLWQGHVRLHMGRLTEARRCLEQALTWSSTLDHPYTTAFTHMLAATTFNSEYLRELKTAMTHIQSAVKLAKEGGFAYLLAICTFYWGGSLLLPVYGRAIVHRRQ